MLSIRDYQELLNFGVETPEVVSLYLEIDASQTGQRRVKSLLKEAAEKDPRLQYLSPDLEKIEEYVLAEFEPARHRGLAVFCCRARGFWQAWSLPEPVKDQLRVGDRPYLPPLLNIMEQYRRYGVALVDKDKARFVEVYLGQAEERSEPLPAQAASVEPALEGPQRHLKAVADRLLYLTRRRGFERVILVVPQELESLLINHLHSFLQNNLIIDSQLNAGSTPEEVLEKVRTGEQQSRKVRESVLVHRLLDGVKSAGMGVVGLWETLNALQRGEVRMLLVRDGLAKMGRKCPGCGRLSIEGKRCHACYHNTEPLFNLVSAMVELALDLNCEVVRIFHDTRLDHVGGIGAELKFKASAEISLQKAGS